MFFDYIRFKEYIIGQYCIITGTNTDLWKILPILYAAGFNLFYKNQIIIIDLAEPGD